MFTAMRVDTMVGKRKGQPQCNALEQAKVPVSFPPARTNIRNATLLVRFRLLAATAIKNLSSHWFWHLMKSEELTAIIPV